MKLKKTLFSALLGLCCLSASAQSEQVENVFNPHWYVMLQGGAQYTLGEVSFGDLVSPNAQVGVGYYFNSVVGARLTVDAWQSKAGSTFDGYLHNGTDYKYKWKWNYVAPKLDVTFNLSNLFCGYNPNRLLDFSVFAGVGVNAAFKNDEAQTVSAEMTKMYPNVQNDDQYLRYLWDGTKMRVMGQVGADLDVRLSDAVSLGLEVSANTLNDKYNSKKAGNWDWYFNGLVGLKINLGKTHTTRPKQIEKEIIYQDRIVEKPVEKIVEKYIEKEAAEEPLKETIFYAIRISDPNADEIIDKVVAWCYKYPTKGITVSGYADKGTGNPKINKGYAQKRAEKIAKILKKKGIASSRISVNSYGDTVQPFAENDMNRCVIIVGE